MWRYWKIIISFIVLAPLFFFLGAVSSKLDISHQTVIESAKLIGLEFSQAERDSMLAGLEANRQSYQKIRETTIPNGLPPALNFNPIPQGMKLEKEQQAIELLARKIAVPQNFEELAFYSVRDLGELIRTRKITSLQLTKMYLDRLKKFDAKLHCVVSITEELAMRQAQRADDEIAAGNYRSPLHGIPYGAKDLLSVKGYKTTWGAMPYKDQVIDANATVITKLEEAGAVLVAKLTLGALAWGDVWYDGKTRNPWNIEQGSSGSSAGPSSATAAGLVAFSIGSETWGSIVSPSTRCGNTGLRPTYGRVSRTGAMALSWSMDKIGPICRSVEDCALVFQAIIGEDGLDQTLVDVPFNYNHEIDLKKLKIGYVKSAFESDYDNKKTDLSTLEKLRDLGAELVPIELPDLPIRSLSFILSAEAAAAFDDLTRSNKDDLLVRQIKNAWPNVFRTSRFIPAVEYIQANRLRYRAIQEMHKILQEVDLYIAPSFIGNNLLLTNLTGHPSVVLPNGFNSKNSPVSITFMGKLYDEATLLAVAKKYQDATDFHLQYPPAFN
ncbi:MAG: amidase [Calditrichaeota bacterium]|nr:MAG: amidase [Calditrichota bacterium]